MPEYLEAPGSVAEEYSPDGFSKVRIVDTGFEYIYSLTPPRLSGEEERLLAETLEELPYTLSPRELLSPSKLEEKLREQGLDDKLVYFIMARVQGYDWLEPLMRDERLEDIHCFRPDTPLRVVHRDYGLLKTNLVPSREEVDRMVKLLAYRGGSAVSLFRPVEDTVILPTGDRAALTYSSQVSLASSFTIRKFPKNPWTPTKMVATGMASPELLALLWLALEAKVPIIVYGPMRTGKTSLVNSLVMLVSPEASIAIVQDSPEMRVYHENVLYLFTSERVGFEELAKLALRKSVDYLIVNEVRVREEAYWWAQLVGTGHGGLTTIHADSLERVFGRLKDLEVEESLAETVKFAVRTELFRGEKDGKKIRVRRVKQVDFVEGLSGYRPLHTPLYVYDRASDRHVRGKGFDKALGFLEEQLGVPLEQELRARAEFLALSRAFGVLEAERFWSLHVEFRRNPEAVLSRLRSGVRHFGARTPPRVKVLASLDEIRYCPRCGAELSPGATVCPRCGFKIRLVPRQR